MSGLLAPFFNFAILVAALAYYLREPMRQFVRSRHEGLRQEIGSVREQLKDARDRHEEFTSKLRAVDSEVAVLREQSRQDAQAMKTRIVSEAQRLSSQIGQDARLAVHNLYVELRLELHHELGVRILDRAEALLRDRLTGEDRIRIRREFSSQVEKVS